MIRENQRLLNQLNVLTDGAVTFVAMLLSYWLRFDVLSGDRTLSFGHYVWLGVGAALLLLVVFAVAGLYGSFRIRRFHVESGRVTALNILVALVVMASMYLLRFSDTSRLTVVFFYVISTILLIGKRACLRMILRHYRAMGYNQKHVLLVGDGENAETYMEKVAADRNFGFDVIG